MSIHMQNVTKKYGSTLGIDNINLEFAAGEVIGLIGLNGSGKTTTLKLLSGLLRPTQGEILIAGKSPRANRGMLAFHSELDTLYEWFDISGARRFMCGLYPDFSAEKYDELVASLDIPSGTCAQMSKGQKSRFKLAMTLARRARVFLLDEPLSGIDIISRRKIMDTLVSERRSDATMVVSTHEVELAAEMFDRFIIVSAGKVVLDESKEEIKARNKNIVDIFGEVIA